VALKTWFENSTRKTNFLSVITAAGVVVVPIGFGSKVFFSIGLDSKLAVPTANMDYCG
jgi:hypothetical protein